MGVVPFRTLRFQMNDGRCLLIEPMDNCIYTDYRGGAILRALVEANDAVSCYEGIRSLFGFPTTEHFKFGKRILGYKGAFQPLTWRQPLIRGLNMQARLRSGFVRRLSYAIGVLLQEFIASWRKPVLSGKAIHIKELHRFDEGVDHLWEGIRSQVRFAVVRDAAYLT